MHCTSVSALLVVVSLVLAPAAQQPGDHEAHHLALVTARTPAALAQLVALELDLAACSPLAPGAKAVEVIATDADLAVLEASGLPFSVSIRDLEAYHAHELSKSGPFRGGLTPPLGQGSMGGHYTWAQVVAHLDKFAAQHPAICASKVSLGKSVEGRDIWMVKISDNVGVDESEPEVFYDALHHAREPLSMETTLLFMSELLDGYGTDPEATYIVNERELYFVPVVNPDGYEYNRRTNPGGGGMWRKNRRNYNGTYGVDLNRNYATGFGGGGSSGNRRSETYRGPRAFSEPETAAVEQFLQGRSISQSLSAHSYTDVLLRAWGYKSGNPPNAADYDRVGRVATRINGIRHGSALALLYQASGTALDHHHEAHGCLGWSPELGRSSEGGFWPNSANTVRIATRHQSMFRAVALLSGPELRDGEIFLMSDGALGTTAVLGMLGDRGATAVPLLSSGTANTPIPGIAGNLLLAPSALVGLAPQRFGPSGYLTAEMLLPQSPSLRGQTLFLQQLHVGADRLLLGNRQQVTLN